MRLILKKKLFNKTFLPFLDDQTRIQIFFGGSASGKSKFLAQRCIHDLLQGQRNYLIVRKVSTSIRSSTFHEIRKVIDEWSLGKYFKVNIAEMVVTCKTGCQALFKGLDDVEKIKSITPAKGVLTDVWIEEATEISLDDIRQLKKRLRGKSKVLKRLALSFNPIYKNHWLFKEFFTYFDEKQQLYRDGKKLVILKTTYKDNRFLEQDDIDELENETDEYWYNVYTLGKWGTLGDVIFKNWEIRDITDQEMKIFDNYRNGLDFGFAKDPAAFIRSHYDKKHKIIYILNEVYEIGLTNPELAILVDTILGDDYVVCDSAEPKSIRELKINGISAIPAVKGKDSVNFGIQWLQQQKIVIDRHCQNVINEFQLYQWKRDKFGVPLSPPKPVDRDNHAIDATRYAYEDDMEGMNVAVADDIEVLTTVTEQDWE